MMQQQAYSTDEKKRVAYATRFLLIWRSGRGCEKLSPVKFFRQ